MAYCRFSSDNFRSDVYCYYSDGVYVVHVKWLAGGPYDGDSRDFDTPGETAEFLRTLREHGYYVPQDAIDELEREQEDQNEAGDHTKQINGL